MISIVVDEQTVLRSPVAGDGRVLFDLVDANRDHLAEWLPWLDENRTLDDTRSFIERSRALEREGRGLTLLIEHSDALAGVIGFNWIDPANASGEMGYWLARELEGQGIMTCSVRALARYAFGTLGLNRLNIPVEVRNRRSRSIPERLGFRAEGVMREAARLNEGYVDLVLYALLASEQERMGAGP